MAREDRGHDDRDRRDRDKRGREKSASPPNPRDRDRDSRRRSPPSKRRRDEDYDSGRRGDGRGTSASLGRGEGPGYGAGRRWRHDADERGRVASRGDVSYDERGRGREQSREGGPSEGLMTYKQFMASLDDDVTPAEAQERYDEYKEKETKRLKEVYFERNKNQDWLKDKYHPARVKEALKRRNEAHQNLAKEYLKELEAGSKDLAEKSERAPTVPQVAGEERRIKHDIEQTSALIKKLDNEKHIEGNTLVAPPDETKQEDGVSTGKPFGLEGAELLDAFLSYLWRVHYLDYYGAIESRDGRGFRHVRASKNGDKKPDEKADVAWEQKVDQKWQARLQGKDYLSSMLGEDKLDEQITKGLENHVRKIKDEKYGWKFGCGAKGCTKLFHGSEFVLKHLKLKHIKDVVEEVKEKILEDLYLENYMNDPDAPIATSSTRSSLPRDRSRGPSRIPIRDRISGFDEPPKDYDDTPPEHPGLSRDLASRLGRPPYRRPYSPGRFSPPRDDYPMRAPPPYDHPVLYDERGMPIDGDRRYPPFDEEFGPPDGEGPPFGGPGMRPPPGGHPPPHVLIPVEGAGPLGPFIPAPPEVAREIMLRRGGATPPNGPILLPPDYDGPGSLAPRRPPPPDFDGPLPDDHPGGAEPLPGGSRGRGERGPPPPHMGRGRGPRGPPFFGRGPPHMGPGMYPPPMMPLGPPPGVRHDPRGMREYVDLDAPTEEVTVLDYRSL